ncbi:MAG: cold-shock DNA-binding protein [uncultured bacterium]|nr:MAG: cold-shock DNA-binding protein [uncultured bacterium]
MRVNGKMVDWKDDSGFGFIEPSTGGKRVFVHIKAFPAGSQRLVFSKMACKALWL